MSMLPLTRLLAMATTFTVLDYDPRKCAERITVERRVARDGAVRWGVFGISGGALSKRYRLWLHEGLPSSRTDEDLEDSRWDNLDEALTAALAEADAYRSMGHVAYWQDHSRRSEEAFGPAS